MRLSRHRLNSGWSELGFNMTPMIDIVFLLIIFFMTVAQITRVSDYPLSLPRVPDEELENKVVTITINLNPVGDLYVAGQKFSMEQTLEALKGQLRKFDNDPQRITIQLRCDRNCDCRHVNALVSELSGLGFQQVRYAVTSRGRD